VVAVLERARAVGVHDELLTALRGPVTALCVGPVTAEPLVDLDVPVSCPDRMRLGSLMKHTTEVLAERSCLTPAAASSGPRRTPRPRGRCSAAAFPIRPRGSASRPPARPSCPGWPTRQAWGRRTDRDCRCPARGGWLP